MQTMTSAVASKRAKTWTIVWGWYGNPSMLQREAFTCRRACWARVQEIMALRSDAVKRATGHDYVSVLEVWSARADSKPGSDVSAFKVYTPGPWQKWGAWGVYKSMTTGDLCG